MHRLWIFTVMVASAGCHGCHESHSGGKTVGELGNGEFFYTCVNANDEACEGATAVFPECVLIGGEFEMDYLLHETDAVDDDDFDLFVYVESASQDFFAGNGHYRAERLGRAAFLAREDEQIIDIIHLDIVAAIGVDVRDLLGEPITDAVEVERGRTTTFDVFAVTDGCSPVGGGGPVTATSSDPAIATVSADDRVLIHGEEVGRTTITVSMGGFEKAVEVEVLQGAPRRRKPTDTTDGGDETGDGSSDGGGTSDDGTGDGAGSSSGSEG
jgi:hypothetical protein